MAEDVEVRANAQHLRAILVLYYIARCLQKGDLEEANARYQSEKDAFMSSESPIHLGSCGAVLTRLQAYGLIEDFDQEDLNPVNEEELGDIVSGLKEKLSKDQLEEVERELAPKAWEASK